MPKLATKSSSCPMTMAIENMPACSVPTRRVATTESTGKIMPQTHQLKVLAM